MKSKKKKILYVFLIIFLIEAVISIGLNYKLQIGFDEGKFVIRNVEAKENIQEKIHEEFQTDKIIQIAGKFPINWNVIRVILVVDILLLLFAISIYRKARLIPSKMQIIAEETYSFFRTLVTETIGKDKVYFTPYIITLFFFIFLCNIIGIIPIPGNMEPTRNLNVPLGLGIMVISIVHFSAIKAKGFGKYLKDFAEPMPFMIPLNIMSELGSCVSISFRLFGNILGGAIIILVVSNLTRFILLPVGLNLFFGLFIGTVQAFVFTMLALSYTAVAIK
ncbi:MAG: F0F1 ATP synthase subunit A [Candidatus Cloacimonadota bacterium]|nr:F0F1 ATP synthase subunit A [Candidatus Cloacimonadota bacterium]